MTDIPFGRIFRISPKGGWDLVVEYDGEPNGLKIHRDGRIFVADHKRGLMLLDAAGRGVCPDRRPGLATLAAHPRQSTPGQRRCQ